MTNDEFIWKVLPVELEESFLGRIRLMNETFELESNDKPTDLGPARLSLFIKTLKEEVQELHDCNDEANIDLVSLSDVLADLVVYIFSEARRWGIPLLEVLHLVMDSQDSKLVDGKPLKSPDNAKFIKGPNYVPPEPQIAQLLRELAKGSSNA